MRTNRSAGLVTLIGAVVALLAAGCGNPKSEAATAQALNDAASEISGLKNDIAQLQTDMDSLRTTVAKQDSLINRIMAVSNIPR